MKQQRYLDDGMYVREQASGIVLIIDDDQTIWLTLNSNRCRLVYLGPMAISNLQRFLKNTGFDTPPAKTMTAAKLLEKLGDEVTQIHSQELIQRALDSGDPPWTVAERILREEPELVRIATLRLRLIKMFEEE